MLQTSKLTGKYQATVPTSIRKALNLSAGDLIGFEIIGAEVRLTRVTPLDVAFTQALESTLEEWSSENDDIAFKDL
jgi:antitoxin PrlF